MFSTLERTAHVVRRLGVGADPALVLRLPDPDAAIAQILRLPDRPEELPDVAVPATWEEVDYELLARRLVPWWIELMASGKQPLVERLTWFWHDHFAVSAGKVSHSYVMWQHHRLIRSHAAADFEQLLRGVARDAAMLWYLDGAQNAYGALNENFGREVMELHTIGRGNYTQRDVSEIARAFTGWVINEPHWERDGFVREDQPGWIGILDQERHDPAMKVILGRTGDLGMDDALDLLLEHPATARNVARSLYRELIGLEPDDATVARLGAAFALDYRIPGLVAAITAEPAFLSDDAIRSKVRTPLEKLLTVLQGLPRADDATPESLFWMLDKLSYLPFHPPNPAGFPSGPALLDPARMLGAFELLNQTRNLDEDGSPPVDIPTALGLFDLSPETRRMLDRFPRPGLRLGLAFGSPEFLAV